MRAWEANLAGTAIAVLLVMGWVTAAHVASDDGGRRHFHGIEMPAEAPPVDPAAGDVTIPARTAAAVLGVTVDRDTGPTPPPTSSTTTPTTTPGTTPTSAPPEPAPRSPVEGVLEPVDALVEPVEPVFAPLLAPVRGLVRALTGIS